MEEFILIERENINEENIDGLNKKPNEYYWIKEYFREIKDFITNLEPDDILSLLELAFLTF